MDEKYALGVNEMAEYTGIGRNMLRKLIDWGKIPVIKIGNKHLIRKETMWEFLRLNEGTDLKNRFEVVAIQPGKQYNYCEPA